MLFPLVNMGFIIKYNRLYLTDLLFQNSGDWKSEILAPTWSGCGESSISGCTFSDSVLTWWIVSCLVLLLQGD